jgi:hypothetical protein
MTTTPTAPDATEERTFEVVVDAGEDPQDAAREFAAEASADVTAVRIDPRSGGQWPYITFAGPATELDKLTAWYEEFLT